MEILSTRGYGCREGAFDGPGTNEIENRKSRNGAAGGDIPAGPIPDERDAGIVAKQSRRESWALYFRPWDYRTGDEVLTVVALHLGLQTFGEVAHFAADFAVGIFPTTLPSRRSNQAVSPALP